MLNNTVKGEGSSLNPNGDRKASILPGLEIFRIVVYDTATYTCLYDEMTFWKGDSSKEALANLIRTYLSFATEIDVGEILSIKFSTDNEPVRYAKSRNRSGFLLDSQDKEKENICLFCHKGVNTLSLAFVGNDEKASEVKLLLNSFDQAVQNTSRPFNVDNVASEIQAILRNFAKKTDGPLL